MITKKIELSTDLEKTLMEFAKITDDMIQDEDGYSSVKLGMRLFCPDGQVENAIFTNNITMIKHRKIFIHDKLSNMLR